MPFPKNFSKTKWLAFFAELSSKISHHSPSVIVEGAELLRRLLMTQLGIAAFLEEGSLLHQICDTLESLLNASGRQYQGILSSDTEATFSLLQCLSEVVSLSVALFNEKDAYYSLLVMSRMDSTVLKMLCGVLRSHIVDTPVPGSDANSGAPTVASTTSKTKQSPFFGFALSIVQTIVSALPVGSFRVDVESIVPTEAHLPNSASVRHVRSMEALCRGEDILRELRNAVDTLIAAQTTQVGNATALALKALHLQISLGLSGSSSYPELGEEEKHDEIKSAVSQAFDMVRSAKDHAGVHLGLNAVWCCLVADGAVASAFLDMSKLSSLERFCRTEPRSPDDLALFRSILCFFSALCHVVDDSPVELQRFLIESVAPSVIAHMKVHGGGSVVSSADGHGNATTATTGAPQALSTVQFLRNSGAPVEPVQRPSPTLSTLLFLYVVSTSCRALRGDDIGRWVRAQGFFLRLLNLLEECGNVSSPLLEAPFAADGTLPDELYLQSALATCRTDTTASASVAMKLITELLLSFGSGLQAAISTELTTLVKAALPTAVRIASHHPTMSCASGSAPSLLHYVPLCIRSTRPCSVGESALLTIDTLVATALQIELDSVSTNPLGNFAGSPNRGGNNNSEGGSSVFMLNFDTIAPWLPNLMRFTKDSVQPHLRSVVHRLLVRVCKNAGALRALTHILPSFTHQAAETVLNQKSRASWEVAGAALWLSGVLRIAHSDIHRSSAVPLDMLLVPALPRNLLHVASTMPPSYGSGALLQLLCALAEHQKSTGHVTSLPTNEEADIARALAGHAPDLVGSVVAPDGSASVATWTSMLESYTTMAKRVDLAPFGGDEIRSVTDDALFRARGAMEEQTARTWYASQLFHAVRLLVERHRDLQRAIPVDVLCDAVGTLLCSPLPSVVRSSLEAKYAVSLPKPTQLLETTDEAIRAGMGLLRVFYDPAGVQQGVLPPVSKTCMEGICAALSSVELAPRTRALVASFLNDLLSNPSQTNPMHSIEQFAATAFLSTRASSASDDIPAIFGLRCRLVSQFEAASHAATSCSWLHDCIKRLANVVHSLMMQRAPTTTPPSDLDQTEVQFALSGIASVLAYPQSLPLDKADVSSCAGSILSLLKLPWAQPISIRACRALANSAEGRAILSCDLPSATAAGGGGGGSSPTSSSPHHNHHHHHAHKDVTTLIRNPFAKLVQITFFGKLPSVDDATCGTDAVSVATLREPESFAPWLIKFKVLDSVNAMLALCSRQKIAAPLAVYRFLASATVAEDMRLAVAHNHDVVELLTEAAESVTPHGTLAIMTLRNLTFSAALKNQICTSDSTMRLFKRVLWLLPNVGPGGSGGHGGSGGGAAISPLSPHAQNGSHRTRSSGRGGNKKQKLSSSSPSSPLSPSSPFSNPDSTPEDIMMAHAGNLDLFRRQELAASALWALVDGNQRAKSFIRNCLKADRPCTLEEARNQLNAVGGLSDLPGYPEKVLATLDILEEHGLSQQALKSSS